MWSDDDKLSFTVTSWKATRTAILMYKFMAQDMRGMHRKKSVGQIRIKLCFICNSCQLGFSEVQNFSNLGKMVVLLLKMV